MAATLVEQISVIADSKPCKVIGGEWSDMKDAVKATGAKFHRAYGPHKNVWITAMTLPELREELSPLKVLGNDEEELLDEVQAEIEELCATIKDLELILRIQAGINNAKASKFSYKSKSTAKAKLLRDAGCYRGAMNAAQKSSLDITEAEIRIMQAAIRRIDDEPSPTLEEWQEFVASSHDLTSIEIPGHWVRSGNSSEKITIAG